MNQVSKKLKKPLKHFKSICIQTRPKKLFSTWIFQTFLCYSCYSKVKYYKTLITGMYLTADITAKNKLNELTKEHVAETVLVL